MDEKKLQQLMDLASAAYNQGKYPEAIARWKEALELDPENQQAREGIRMANLLVVNWEGSQAEAAGGELTIESPGADPQTQEKIEFGIRRVRDLLASGRHKEAMEGCQLLVELAPGMSAVRQLHEEVAHALEAGPFVEEHLGRARKLLAAGRTAEAAEEARKVLTVEPSSEEARTIASQAAGSATAPLPAQSAFETEGAAAPPSPFAGTASADALLASMDLEESAETKEIPGGEMPLEMGFEEAGAPAAAAAPENPEIAGLIREGQALFDQKKYQEAIDAWSRIYAIDAGHEGVAQKIDAAKAKIASIAAQVEQALYQGQDQMEAGNLSGARKAFEEALAIQPGHAEALEKIAKIDERIAADEIGEAIPVNRQPPEPEAPPAKAPAASPVFPEPPEAIPLDRDPADEGALHRRPSAGAFRKKPVVPVPPPRRGGGAVVFGLVAVIVIGGAAGGWWFLRGSTAEPPPDSASVAANPDAPKPAPAPPEKPGKPQDASKKGTAPATEKMAGVSPDAAPPKVAAPRPSSPPIPKDPAVVKERVDALMKEGRALLDQGKYPDARDKFIEVLRLQPANFDAEDLRMKAAEGLAEETRFDRDLAAAKKAFADQDWAGALYKFYRLQQEHENMTVLKRYIENANYNWGVQDLQAFRLDQATQHFKDALEQSPKERMILQHLSVADRYAKRPRDAAFDAYADKLRLRSLDEN